MKIKISEAAELITTALKAKLVPMIHGSPAIGKSAIVKWIAKQFGLKIIDLRLSQCDPTDLMGFPSIGTNVDRAKARAGYVPMETFPIEGDKVPEGYNGWLLFLDEFNSAPLGVQAAAYKLVLDRMVGVHNLHRNVAIVCAGNLETDGAIVQPMSTALQSRLVHLEVAADVKDWLSWAYAEDFDHRITSYIEFRPDHLYTFSPDHTDKTYASNRTWEFANRILKVVPTVDKKLLPLLAGTISEGVAREFVGFCQIHDRMLKFEQIVSSPHTVEVPNEPSVQFALCGAIAANVTKENCAPVMDFVARLPPEFQVVCVRSIVKRKPEFLKYPSFAPWITRMANDLM